VGVKAGAKAQLAAVDDTAIKHEMESFMVVSFGRSEPVGCWLLLSWFYAVAGSLTFYLQLCVELYFTFTVSVFIYQDTCLLFIHKGIKMTVNRRRRRKRRFDNGVRRESSPNIKQAARIEY
jgi:hypothetical protein